MQVPRKPDEMLAAFRPTLVILLLVSCGAPDQQSETAIDIPAASAAFAPGDGGEDTPATPHRARSVNPNSPYSGDLGIGVFHFAWHEDRPRDASADTIRVRREPTPSSPVVARFIYTFGATASPDAAWTWAVESNESGLASNEVEFDYEENGLPVDSIAGDWVRVIYAITPAGQPRKGWARRRQDTNVRLWREYLGGRNLFFLDAATASFHSSRDGPSVRLELARGRAGRPDYTMYPDEVSGRWMRVRVVTPSDQCIDPTNPKRDSVWIRYIDERGRPLVFYHSRGC